MIIKKFFDQQLQPSQKCDCEHLPKRQILPTYKEVVREESGFVWYLLDGNDNDKTCPHPSVPTQVLDGMIAQERQMGVTWKPVYGEIMFDAPHWNVFDNAIDITHIHFLHGDSFGNSSKPEIKDFQVLDHDEHFAHMKFKIYNKPANFLWHWTIVDNVDVDIQIRLPYTSIIKISLGAGVQMITVVNTTPINAYQSMNRFCLWRNFAPWSVFDGVAYRAMMTILGQDKAMVELLHPERCESEISLRSDMPQIVFRNLRKNVKNKT